MVTRQQRWHALRIGLLTLLVAVALSEAPAGQGSLTLAERVAEARRQGKTSLKLGFLHSNDGEYSPLFWLLDSYGVFVVKSTGTNVASVVGDDIYTWSKVFLVREIAPAKLRDEPSALAIPDGLSLDEPWAMALVSSGGTVVIDGITVTKSNMEGDVRLQPGRTYLVIGELRTPLVLGSAYETKTVFEVGNDGRLRSVYEHKHLPFTQEIESLGTIDAVADYVAKLKAIKQDRKRSAG